MTEKGKKEKDEEKYETDRKIERLEMRVKNLEETLAIQQELIRQIDIHRRRSKSLETRNTNSFFSTSVNTTAHKANGTTKRYKGGLSLPYVGYTQPSYS
jgi:hypothetical protein